MTGRGPYSRTGETLYVYNAYTKVYTQQVRDEGSTYDEMQHNYVYSMYTYALSHTIYTHTDRILVFVEVVIEIAERGILHDNGSRVADAAHQVDDIEIANGRQFLHNSHFLVCICLQLLPLIWVEGAGDAHACSIGKDMPHLLEPPYYILCYSMHTVYVCCDIGNAVTDILQDM